MTSLIKHIYDNLDSTKIDVIINELEDMGNALSMLDRLDEGVTDLPDGLDIDQQFEKAIARLEAAQRGLELLKKLRKHVAAYKNKHDLLRKSKLSDLDDAHEGMSGRDHEIIQNYKKAREFINKNNAMLMRNISALGAFAEKLARDDGEENMDNGPSEPPSFKSSTFQRNPNNPKRPEQSWTKPEDQGSSQFTSSDSKFRTSSFRPNPNKPNPKSPEQQNRPWTEKIGNLLNRNRQFS